MSWLRRLRAIPELLISIAILKADIEATLTDSEIKDAVDRFREDPVIRVLVPRFSAEIRAVEEAVSRLR